jgi:HAD superfamily hydrolase (TIGR01549 family)
MRMIKAVIIDLDDTLCLTEAACFDMENEVLARLGRKPMTREIHIATWGRPLFEAIEDRSPGVDVAKFKATFEPLIAEYTASGKLDAIPAENYRALDELIAANKLVMLLTSRTHAELKHILEPDHGLAERIKAFYYREVMEYHKPDPRAFAEMLRDNHLQANDCVYVGDSVSDAVAAKEAGLHFVASLESGLRKQEDFAHLPVDVFIQSFPEIVTAVRSLET